MSSLNLQPFHLKYPINHQTTYEGIVISGKITPARDLARVRDFKVREDDIAVVAYVRTGSRWTVEMISWICADGEDEKFKQVLNLVRAPQLESQILASEDKEVNFRSEVWIDVLSRMPHNEQRMYSSHLQFQHAPKQLAERGKVVCVIRNPKDNVVSLYHLYQIFTPFGPYSGPWHDFLAGYMAGDMIWGSYFDWLHSWWPQRHNKNVLFVYYEEMKKDHPGSVRKIAEFLGKSLDEDIIQKIVEKTSFAAMKSSPLTNLSRNEECLKSVFETPGEGIGEFVRKGEVGDWKNYFTVKQSEEFDKLVEEKLGCLGIEFEYE